MRQKPLKSPKYAVLFRCEYCEREIDAELSGTAFRYDQFHDCLGENIGLVAMLYEDKISTTEGVTVDAEIVHV